MFLFVFEHINKINTVIITLRRVSGKKGTTLKEVLFPKQTVYLYILSLIGIIQHNYLWYTYKPCSLGLG